MFTANAGDAEAAAGAGAVIVGGDDLVAQVAQDKGIAADTVVATPDMVPRLSKIARILGPKSVPPPPALRHPSSAEAFFVSGVS